MPEKQEKDPSPLITPVTREDILLTMPLAPGRQVARLPAPGDLAAAYDFQALSDYLAPLTPPCRGSVSYTFNELKGRRRDKAPRAAQRELDYVLERLETAQRHKFNGMLCVIFNDNNDDIHVHDQEVAVQTLRGRDGSLDTTRVYSAASVNAPAPDPLVPVPEVSLYARDVEAAFSPGRMDVIRIGAYVWHSAPCPPAAPAVTPRLVIMGFRV